MKKSSLNELLEDSQSLQNGGEKENRFRIGFPQIGRFFNSISETWQDLIQGNLV
jgi:hypothetical protein